MSGKMDVYTVPFDALQQAAGSRDRRLLEAVVANVGWMLEEADRKRLDEDRRTCRDALRQIIDGDDLSEVPYHLGYLHGYALEALIAHLGMHLGEVHGGPGWC